MGPPFQEKTLFYFVTIHYEFVKLSLYFIVTLISALHTLKHVLSPWHFLPVSHRKSTALPLKHESHVPLLSQLKFDL